MRRIKFQVIFTLVLVWTCIQSLVAQTTEQTLSSVIRQKDSLFWLAYNNCDTVSFPQFFTEDVEFYHDKGGITLGLESLSNSMKKNLCSNKNFRLRREVLDGSVRVFPLSNSNVIYGAILSGEHVFYVLEPGKKERLDGQARFSHVWLLKDSAWKMARVLSYDHGPAKLINRKKEITLAGKITDQFTGIYQAPQSGTLTVKKDGGLLTLTIKNNTMVLYPETENCFFVKDRDLTFEFIKNTESKVSKLLVRENGQIVEEAISKN